MQFELFHDTVFDLVQEIVMSSKEEQVITVTTHIK